MDVLTVYIIGRFTVLAVASFVNDQRDNLTFQLL